MAYCVLNPNSTIAPMVYVLLRLAFWWPSGTLVTYSRLSKLTDCTTIVGRSTTAARPWAQLALRSTTPPGLHVYVRVETLLLFRVAFRMSVESYLRQ